DTLLEGGQAVVVLGQLAANAVGDLLQIADDGAGSLQLTASGVGGVTAATALKASNQITDDGDGGEGDLNWQAWKNYFHDRTHQKNSVGLGPRHGRAANPYGAIGLLAER